MYKLIDNFKNYNFFPHYIHRKLSDIAKFTTFATLQYYHNRICSSIVAAGNVK